MTWHAGAACHPDRKPAHMTAQEWNRTWFPNPNAPVDGVAAPVLALAAAVLVALVGVWVLL